MHLLICITDVGLKFDDLWPLHEAWLQKLTVNYAQLMSRIISEKKFYYTLAGPNVECITWSQREHIVLISQPRDRTYKLLEFSLRGSIASFNKLIGVLSDKQPDIVPLLLTDGG